MSQDIIKLLAAINKRGITVIVVTHDHELLSEFSSRVVELEEGEIISDSANDIKASDEITEEDLFIDDIGDDDGDDEESEEINLPEPEKAPEMPEEAEISVPEEKTEETPEKEDDLLDGFYNRMNTAFDEPEEEKEADENEF